MSFKPGAQKQINPLLTLSEAKKKLMDLIALRDHSEQELREKLELKCTPEIVNAALTWAAEKNWLIAPEKLKHQVAQQLGRRGKGIHRINEKLQSLGLPDIKSDYDVELEKAQRLTSGKWKQDAFQDLKPSDARKLQAKIMRFLLARGFEEDIVIYILTHDFKRNFTDEDTTYDEEC